MIDRRKGLIAGYFRSWCIVCHWPIFIRRVLRAYSAPFILDSRSFGKFPTFSALTQRPERLRWRFPLLTRHATKPDTGSILSP